MPPQPAAPIDLRDDATELLRALHNSELELYYQPIVDLRRREVVGAEALIRWHHPVRGLLLPDAFLPLAEHTGAIVPIGIWVLETACRQGASWAEQGLRLEVAVNLSVRQVSDPDLVEEVRRILVDTGFEPSQLLLEITEPTLTNEVNIGTTLDDLAALGVLLGLDDFGTGHSSLLYLKRHPIAVLKVDTTFVAGLGSNPDDEAIVASVANLASALGNRCIAEGVETEEQHAQLQALGCQAQGNLFGAAVPAAALPAAVDRAETMVEAPTSLGRLERGRRANPKLAADVAERLLTMHQKGASLQTIAAALNHAEALHPRGVRWHASSVARYLSDIVAQTPAAIRR